MGTRSYVAAETESGIKGVYVHWDGYPEGRIPVLQRLIARDGLSKVVRTIIGKPNGWSSLDDRAVDHESAGMAGEMLTGGRFELIPGYGVQYTSTPTEHAPEGQADKAYWTPETHDPDSWAEFIYIITTEGTVRWAETQHGSADVAGFDWHEEVLV